MHNMKPTSTAIIIILSIYFGLAIATSYIPYCNSHHHKFYQQYEANYNCAYKFAT